MNLQALFMELMQINVYFTPDYMEQSLMNYISLLGKLASQNLTVHTVDPK